MDLSPVMALIPTDMGLPLEMELHMPVVASMETKLSVLAALPKPEISMKSRMFLTTQITGWVGTVIPFTKEMAMVAVDNTIVYNLPATVKVSNAAQHRLIHNLKFSETEKRFQKSLKTPSVGNSVKSMI